MPPASYPQLRHIDPATLLPGLEAKLRQLHAASSFQEIMGEWRIFGDVFQEELPLGFEAVVKGLIIRHVLPVLAKVEGIVNVRIPDRSRRIHSMLGPALPQAGDSAARRAVYLQAEEFVAVDAKRPRGVDLRDDAAVELKRPIGRIVRRTLVAFSLLVHPFGDRRASKALHGAH